MSYEKTSFENVDIAAFVDDIASDNNGCIASEVCNSWWFVTWSKTTLLALLSMHQEKDQGQEKSNNMHLACSGSDFFESTQS